MADAAEVAAGGAVRRWLKQHAFPGLTSHCLSCPTQDAALKRKADELDGDAAAEAPEAASEPVALGPKTFPTAEHCFRYFSGLLGAMTCHQDCNEVRRRTALLALV